MAGTLEQQVATQANGYANGATVGQRGLCWEFVHSVLTNAGAKSYPDFQPPPADKRYQAYGELDKTHIHPGYVVVFVDAEFVQMSSTAGGARVTTTTRFPAHVGIVTRIQKGGWVTITHQNHPLDSKTVSRFSFRQADKKKGTLLFFKPVPKGK
jgi:hypothetical protein